MEDDDGNEHANDGFNDRDPGRPLPRPTKRRQKGRRGGGDLADDVFVLDLVAFVAFVEEEDDDDDGGVYNCRQDDSCRPNV